MRFLFIIEGLAVKSGGPPRVAAAVANKLMARGHSVTIGTVPVQAAQVHLADAVAVEQLSPSASVRSAINASRKIRLLARSHDIVVVSGIWGAVDGLALRLARTNYGNIFIRSCGMLEPYILARSPWKKRVARLAYVDHNLSNAAAVLANSSIEQAYIRALFPNAKVEVVPNGVDLPELGRLCPAQAKQELSLRLPDDSRVLLYLGRIDPKKGLDIFIPHFKQLVKAHPEWHLVVAGAFANDAYRDKIMAVSEGASSNIHFVGEVSGKKKDACFQAAQGFVLPSHSEGFPNAVVEALSWQLPAIITPGCNFPEIDEAGAGITTTLEPTQLSRKISQFCLEMDLCHAGIRARELVENRFTLDHIVDRYEGLARQVIS